MKQARQQLILEFVRRREIYTQEELTDALGAAGFSAAQATVSRDIRELGLIKQPGRNGMKYAESGGAGAAGTPLERIFRDGLVSVDFAGNMLVLKTLSGMAMAVAAALDDMKFSEILGSVAGDDVVMCVVKSKAAAAKLAEKLK